MLTDTNYDSLSEQNIKDIEKDPIYFLDFIAIAMLMHMKSQCIPLNTRDSTRGRNRYRMYGNAIEV